MVIGDAESDGSDGMRCGKGVAQEPMTTNMIKPIKKGPSGSFFWSDCADDELVLQPPPTGLLMKVMLWFPYPIIDDIDLQDELPCMD